jgi:hypothetical protein
MCKQHQFERGEDYGNKTMVATILGINNPSADARGRQVDEIYDLFLKKFICGFGIYPNAKDVELFFTYFRQAKKFPNAAELRRMESIIEETKDHEFDTMINKKELSIEFVYQFLLTSCCHTGAGQKDNCRKNSDEKKKDEKKKEVEDCCICLEKLDDEKGQQVVKLSCQHSFHLGSKNASASECSGILKWILKNNNCPMCKAVVINEELFRAKPGKV